MSKMPANEFERCVEVSAASRLVASLAPFGEQFASTAEKPRRISLRELVANYDEHGMRQ